MCDKLVFQTKLPLSIPANYFNCAPPAVLSIPEDQSVCADMLKACGEMERRGLCSSAIAVNGQLQSVLRTPISVLESWGKSASDAITRFVGSVIPLAQKLLCGESFGRAGSSKSLFVLVGSSRLAVERGVMFHVWESSTAAHRFARGWSTLWQSLLVFRIEGIHCPFSVMLNLRGVNVSATLLPPVMTSAAQPLQLPDPALTESMLSYMARNLLAVLCLPQDETRRFTFFEAADARHYIMSLDMVVHRVENFPETLVRTETLQQFMVAEDGIDAATFLRSNAVPAAANRIILCLEALPEDKQQLSALTKQSFLRSEMHRNGINICLLYEMHKQFGQSEGTKRLTKILAEACQVEMVLRVLKEFIRVEVKRRQGESESEICDAVNRIARISSLKDLAFWEKHVEPSVRDKFHLPDTFKIERNDSVIMLVLKLAASRVGIEYDPKVQKFTNASIVTKVFPVFNPNDICANADLGDGKKIVKECWDRCSSVPSVTIAGRALRARALVASLLHKQSVDNEQLDFVTKGCVEPYSLLEASRIANLLCEVRSVSAQDPCALSVDEEAAQRPTGVVCDAPLFAARFFRFAKLRQLRKVSPAMELFLNGVRKILGFRAAVLHHCDWVLESLMSAEAQLPQLGLVKKEICDVQLEKFFEFESAIAARLRSMKPNFSAFLHNLRVLRALMGTAVTETAPATTRLALETYDEIFGHLGVADARTSRALYFVAFFSLKLFDRRVQSSVNLVESMQALIGELLSVEDLQQQEVVGSPRAVDTVIRVYNLISCGTGKQPSPDSIDCAEMDAFLSRASNAIRDHLHYFGETQLSVCLLQRFGKGLLARKHVGCKYSSSGGVRQSTNPEGDPSIDQVVRDLFDRCDADRDGFVTVDQCCSFLRGKCVVSEAELHQIFYAKCPLSKKLNFNALKALTVETRRR